MQQHGPLRYSSALLSPTGIELTCECGIACRRRVEVVRSAPASAKQERAPPNRRGADT